MQNDVEHILAPVHEHQSEWASDKPRVRRKAGTNQMVPHHLLKAAQEEIVEIRTLLVAGQHLNQEMSAKIGQMKAEITRLTKVSTHLESELSKSRKRVAKLTAALTDAAECRLSSAQQIALKALKTKTR